MNVYTKCQRCQKEGAPSWRAGSGAQGLNYQYSEGQYVPPSGWNVVAGYTLCGDCANEVLAVIHKAVGDKGEP